MSRWIGRLRAWWWDFNNVCILCNSPAIDEYGCLCPRCAILRMKAHDSATVTAMRANTRPIAPDHFVD